MCRLRSTTNASPRSWRADPGARRPRTPARPPYSWKVGWRAAFRMNPIQTPPKSPDADEAAGHDDPLDSLLTQIINGFFVLTDGQGAVSKWSEPAELLFGLEAAEVLGKALFETLVDHAPAEAEAWRRFLESGEAPGTRALQNVSAIYAGDKRTFPLEMVFIPVKLDEGFDFSLFLEDLAFELPR